ncbi:PepSY-associated TM helix domain-containing protein [Massilia scottii]|uniref:PepSY-associated TM helix domain-containing protein n=1 Tax=Massilia scottii TaxID=3057166 RepID=UPI002796A669|nr:PepSY-associated TM helix domain-containing protein [Massilia sp. CCM 9029]MDQ1829140.1 PepSY-associated TM helix domain-containing protein [Massilia sp. CCM 9029]
MTAASTPPRLRHAMDYLHTWAGVLCSALLFLVFFMGTLSVFDQEIDRWMMPATRVAQPAAVSFDRLALPHLERLAPDAKQWTVQYPTSRAPAMRLSWFENGALRSRDVDANTGRLLPQAGSRGGTGFFFPFHYTFHIKWMDLGYWLLALVSIAMLALLVSGVIIHKKIFTDFFTFRPARSRQRATLDLHHVSAVLLLPFHFTITLTGLVIMVFVYTKPGIALVYGKQADQATREAFALVLREPSGRRAELASVDAMAAQAQRLWGGGEIRRVSVRNPHDAHASVDFQRRPHDQISYDTRMLSFDGSSGALLGRSDLSATLGLQRFFTGLHMLPFDHWWLRWMYFGMGLVSCVMIGTGMLLWVEKRRVRQVKEGRSSYRVVNAVAAAGSVGVLVATLAMLVSNKLLPEAIAGRALLEQCMFFLVWIGTLVHALARAWQPRFRAELGTAWREQAWASAVLALLAVVLNGVLTGDHLLRSVSQGNMAVAATDLVLLASAALAAVAARRLGSRGAATAGAPRWLKEAAP